MLMTMFKWINISKFISLIVVSMTSVPLCINYYTGKEPNYSIVTDLHVIFGLIFIISAFSSMILTKKLKKGNNNEN